MELYPFYVEVTWGYYESDEQKHIEKQEAVIVFAKTYTDAVSQIEDTYQDDLYSLERVICISDCASIEMPISIGRRFIENIERYERGETPVENKEKIVKWNPLKNPNVPVVPKGTTIVVDYNV